MSACVFFGHRDCFGLDALSVENAIEALIQQGVDTFYVGHQGEFDRMVLRCLKKLKHVYPHVSFFVVLAYLPRRAEQNDVYGQHSVFPEEVATEHPKFAIERRNRWMIHKADYCVCFVDHTWGGAYKFAKLAKRRKLTVLNLGKAEL